jgi:hypothetical protein
VTEGILPEQPDSYRVIGYNPAHGGCTAKGCTSTDTLTLDGTYGRRCWQHSPWRTLAREGKRAEAWAALRAWLGMRR